VNALIRAESPGDVAAIRAVNERAFGGAGEANAIEQLRARGQATISLIAQVEGQVVGHIFFSPVTLEMAHGALAGLGLAPLAVLPEFQRRGLGSQLARAGLKACRELGGEFVVVLGHSGYYPRFGFVRASAFGLRCEWEVPDPAFMALELMPGALANRAGVVKYQPEWSGG
jgi:putative acetyltransferase